MGVFHFLPPMAVSTVLFTPSDAEVSHLNNSRLEPKSVLLRPADHLDSQSDYVRTSRPNRQRCVPIVAKRKQCHPWHCNAQCTRRGFPYRVESHRLLSLSDRRCVLGRRIQPAQLLSSADPSRKANHKRCNHHVISEPVDARAGGHVHRPRPRSPSPAP